MMSLCWRHAPLSQLGGAVMDPQRAQALLTKYQQRQQLGQDAWFLPLLIDASTVETLTGTDCSQGSSSILVPACCSGVPDLLCMVGYPLNSSPGAWPSGGGAISQKALAAQRLEAQQLVEYLAKNQVVRGCVFALDLFGSHQAVIEELSVTTPIPNVSVNSLWNKSGSPRRRGSALTAYG